MNRELNRLLRVKLAEIDRELIDYRPQNLSLYSGLSGIAMYFVQRQISEKGRKFTHHAKDLIQSSIEQCFDQPISLRVEHTVGVLWLLSTLNARGIIKFETRDLRKLNEHIADESAKLILANDHDFFYGANGLALYLLDNLSGGTKHSLEYLGALYEKVVKRSLHNILEHNQPISASGGISSKGTVTNLGISHGIISTIYLLTKFMENRINLSSSSITLRKTIDWLLSMENCDAAISRFPMTFPSTDDFSRLAWCYGDLSIGYVLYRAGTVLADQRILNEAQRIMEKSIYRRDRAATGVIDPSICHGSFGVAYIFYNYWQLSPNSSFYASMEYWMLNGLNKKNPEMVCGFDFERGSVAPEYLVKDLDYSFLMGIAGIGLVIDSVVNKPNTNVWKQFIMLE